MRTKPYVMSNQFFNKKTNIEIFAIIIAMNYQHLSKCWKITYLKKEHYISYIDTITSEDKIKYILRNHIAPYCN